MSYMCLERAFFVYLVSVFSSILSCLPIEGREKRGDRRHLQLDRFHEHEINNSTKI